MSGYDAIVVGGGLNGMVAGAVLARQGKRVCILEQLPTIGGMAAPGADGAPGLAHLVYNLSPLVRKEVGMDRHRWPFQVVDVPTVALSPEHKPIVLRGGQVKYADGTDHPDAKAYRGLVSQLQRYGAILRHLAEGPPPGGGFVPSSPEMWRQIWRLAKMSRGLKRMPRSDMRRFLQVLLSNAFDLILDEMPDGPLAGVLAADAVRGAAVGPRSPGTVFNLIYRMGHGGQPALPIGGIGAVARGFETAAKQAGCDIRTETAVTRILVEQDRVTGVETSAGEILSTATVLTSTGAGAACDMVGPAHFDIEATRRIRNIRARGTTAKINLQLDGLPDIPGLSPDLMGARMVVAPSAEEVELAFNPAKYGQMSQKPVLEMVFPDLTDTDLGPAKPWLSIIVQYAPSDLEGGWTDTARDALLRNTMAELASVMPGAQDRVLASQIITPDRIEAATGAPGGHWHHAEMSLDQLLTLRPANGIGRYAMGPKGLYLCGASTHPGGDLMGLAGRNAARTALEDMG